MAVNNFKKEFEDELDVFYWQSRTDAERLAEITRLRVNYYTWLNGSYSDKIAKVVTKRKL